MRVEALSFKCGALPSLLLALLHSPLCDMHRLVIVRLTGRDTSRQILTVPSALFLKEAVCLHT